MAKEKKTEKPKAGGKDRIPFQGAIHGGGFDKNPQNINRKGAPMSFKRRFKELVEGSKAVRTKLAECTIIKDPKGVEWVEIPIPSVDRMLVRLIEISESNNTKEALNALKFFWEQFDGKAKQTVETIEPAAQYDLSRLTDKELDQWHKLLEKVTIQVQ